MPHFQASEPTSRLTSDIDVILRLIDAAFADDLSHDEVPVGEPPADRVIHRPSSP